MHVYAVHQALRVRLHCSHVWGVGGGGPPVRRHLCPEFVSAVDVVQRVLVLSGWTMNAWSRFARQKVERVFTPISPLTAPFGRCRATRMKRRVCTSASQQQQQRQARPAVAAALSAIWEQGILPALHSLLQHGSDTSTPDSVRIPQRPTRFGYLNARGSTLRTTLDTGLGCHMRGYRADTRHERSPLCCPRASTSCTGLGLRVCRAESLYETVS